MKLYQAIFILPLLIVNTTHSTPITEKIQRTVATFVTYVFCRESAPQAQSESTETNHEHVFANTDGRLTITNTTQGSLVYKAHSKESMLHVCFVGSDSHLGTVNVQGNCATISTGSAPKTSSIDIIVHGPQRLKRLVTQSRCTSINGPVRFDEGRIS